MVPGKSLLVAGAGVVRGKTWASAMSNSTLVVQYGAGALVVLSSGNSYEAKHALRNFSFQGCWRILEVRGSGDDVATGVRPWVVWRVGTSRGFFSRHNLTLRPLPTATDLGNQQGSTQKK